MRDGREYHDLNAPGVGRKTTKADKVYYGEEIFMGVLIPGEFAEESGREVPVTVWWTGGGAVGTVTLTTEDGLMYGEINIPTEDEAAMPQDLQDKLNSSMTWSVTSINQPAGPPMITALTLV